MARVRVRGFDVGGFGLGVDFVVALIVGFGWGFGGVGRMESFLKLAVRCLRRKVVKGIERFECGLPVQRGLKLWSISLRRL